MKKYVFGVDVGGTTVKMGYFDIEGNLIEKWEIPTRTEDKGVNIIPDIAGSILVKLAQKDIDKKEVAGVGIGVPGPVKEDGTVLVAVNLGWDKRNTNEQFNDSVFATVQRNAVCRGRFDRFLQKLYEKPFPCPLYVAIIHRYISMENAFIS